VSDDKRAAYEARVILESEIEDQQARILNLEEALKEIYALTGEDTKISEIFNRVMK